MKEHLFLVAAGIAIGLLLFGVLMTKTDNPFSQGKAALARCHDGLLRNQVCVITAAPKEVEQR